MSYSTKVISALIAVALCSCESSFIGDTGVTGSGGGKFKNGDRSNTTGGFDRDSTGQGGPNGDGFGPNGGPGDGTGTNGGGIGFNDGNANREYGAMTVTGLRRDGDYYGSQYSHENVGFRIRADGGAWTQWTNWPAKDESVTLDNLCAKGAEVRLDFEFRYLNLSSNSYSTVIPNKRVEGGPLAFRESDTVLWVGFETDTPGTNESEFHNNDDAIAKFSCPESSKILSLLCLDQNLIQYHNDWVTDEITWGEGPHRICL